MVMAAAGGKESAGKEEEEVGGGEGETLGRECTAMEDMLLQ